MSRPFVAAAVGSIVGIVGAEILLRSSEDSEVGNRFGVALLVLSIALLGLSALRIRAFGYGLCGCVLIAIFVALRSVRFRGLVKDEDPLALSTYVECALRILIPLWFVVFIAGQIERLLGRFFAQHKPR